jgi:sugar O-acyltransferase (sialic acid O-acetyltransferase NeuD family)
MVKLAILGASGHGKVVAEIAELCGWREVHFFDDNYPNISKLEGWDVKGDTQHLLSAKNNYHSVVVAIGNNSVRYNKMMFLKENGFTICTLVHPKAVVSIYSEIGLGSVVMAGAVVNPFAKVGNACIINTSATVDHDCKLGDAVHVSPGANLAGATNVGSLTWVGIGSTVKQCVSIGRNVIVGAGAVVLQDIPDDVTVVGVPAKIYIGAQTSC